MKRARKKKFVQMKNVIWSVGASTLHRSLFGLLRFLLSRFSSSFDDASEQSHTVQLNGHKIEKTSDEDKSERIDPRK